MNRSYKIIQVLRLRFVFLIIIGSYLLAAGEASACVPAAFPFQWQISSSDFVGIVQVIKIQERSKDSPPLLKVNISKPLKSKLNFTSENKESATSLLVDFSEGGRIDMCNAMWIPTEERYEPGALYLAFLRRTEQSDDGLPVMELTVPPVPVSFLQSFRAIKNNTFADFISLPKAQQFVWMHEYLSAIEHLAEIETLPQPSKIEALQKLVLSAPESSSVPLTYRSGAAMTLSDVAQDWLEDLIVRAAQNE